MNTADHPSGDQPGLKWGLLVAFMLLLLLTAGMTFLVSREYVRAGLPNSLLLPTFEARPTQPTPQVFDPGAPLHTGSLPDPLPWDGVGRVNVLVLGLDMPPADGLEPPRSDSLLLLSLDPATHSAAVLSIPRDLWVNIPGFEYGKINTAYYLGERYALDGGGAGLATRTVEQLVGLPIHYYVQLEYAAFTSLVDEAGGVEVELAQEMNLDLVGSEPETRVVLQPGLQTLNGATALAYTRNKDTVGGDFDRVQRQQQVLLALRSRLLDPARLTGLVQRSPILYMRVADSLQTNLTLEQAVQLVWLAVQIPTESIQRDAIGLGQVTVSLSPGGLDILQPNTDAVRELRDRLFTEQGAIGPNASSDSAERLRIENAHIALLNATTTPGLAAETSDFLTQKGLNIVQANNAQETVQQTTLIAYTDKPYTIEHLLTLLNIDRSRFYFRYDPSSEVDIAILLGDDWATNNAMP